MLPRRKKQTCNYLDDSWGVAPILPAKNIILLCMAFLSKIPPNAPMLQVAWKRVWVPGVCTDGSENANGWCYSGITGSGSLCFRPWPHTSRRTIFWLKYCISPIWIKVLWGGFLSLPPFVSWGRVRSWRHQLPRTIPPQRNMVTWSS